MLDSPICSVSNQTIYAFFYAYSIQDTALLDNAVKDIMTELLNGFPVKSWLALQKDPKFLSKTASIICDEKEACIPDNLVSGLVKAYLDKDESMFSDICTQIAEEFDIHNLCAPASFIYEVILR